MKNIIVKNWVRFKCTFGCPDFGRAACPPNVPSVDECKNFFNEYKKAVVFRFNFEAEKTRYPRKFDREITGKLRNLERNIFLNNYYKVVTVINF